MGGRLAGASYRAAAATSIATDGIEASLAEDRGRRPSPSAQPIAVATNTAFWRAGTTARVATESKPGLAAAWPIAA
jgi:hypothetical protein